MKIVVCGRIQRDCCKINYSVGGKMKKICLILENYFNYFKGGAELQAYFIARGLIKENEVHYIFVKHHGFNEKKFRRIDDGIILHPIKLYDYNFFSTSFFQNYWELQKLLDDINPDLIYERGEYFGIATNWCKKNNKKLFLGISQNITCYKRSILGSKYRLFSFPSNIINGFFTFVGIKNANLIIAQNHQQQKLLQQNFNRNSVVIPNGHPVPLPPFKKVDPPIISWIANIKKLKQPELFIKLAEACQDLNVQFVYAGRLAQASYNNIFMRKTKTLPNLKYLGELPFEKTNELLSKSTLFINTSLTEGFPNTYIQAWMRETPVVVLNCDPDDLIKTHKMGFHSGDFEQLVKDVRYLIKNEDVRREMGEKAREYALKNHDIGKIGKRYLEVFEML